MSGRPRRKPTVRDTLGPLLSLPLTWPADVTAVICATADSPSVFDDDVLMACAGCGVALRHRPYLPSQLTKLCGPCAQAQAAFAAYPPASRSQTLNASRVRAGAARHWRPPPAGFQRSSRPSGCPRQRPS